MCFVSPLTFRETYHFGLIKQSFGAENLVPASLCSLSNSLTSPENALFPVAFIHLDTSQEYNSFFL